MNIDRHNYEEFFILYLDNELSADERRRVEDFAAAHPDLKEELDLLLQSKLVPDNDIIFTGKEELLKHTEGISTHNYTEWLVLYTDNELSPAQKTAVEQWMINNPAAQDELSLLQKARLQPDESIVFADKHLLYRKEEERRVVPIRWWRMAAAAALLLAVSTTAFMFNRKGQAPVASGTGDTSIANPVAEVKTTTTNDSSSKPVQGSSNTEITPATATPNHITGGEKTPGKTGVFTNAGNSNKKETDQSINTFQQPEEGLTPTAPEVNTDIIKRGDMTGIRNSAHSVDIDNFEADPALTIQKQITPLPGVTQEETQPLDIVNQSGKKNKLRGFFRKITRTFEKTTNIKATDGEDRLLVGGLAIKF